MALWLPKTLLQAAKQHVSATSYAVLSQDYSTQPKIIKNPTTARLRRGTGGRSSFNGIVCSIFGCTGFIGRYVCNRLAKIGTQLILPYRGNEYDIMNLKPAGDLGQILFQPFHLKDEDSIRKCIKYSNVVINLIGTEYETKNFSFQDVHVDGARRLARLSKDAGVDRFIHISSLNVNPNPKPLILPSGSNILRTKWEGECAVKEEFPEATIIRLADVYGQEDRFLDLYSSRNRKIFNTMYLWKLGKETEKQPIHISDVAGGITAAVLNENAASKTYQFYGPKRYKLYDLVNWILDYVEGDQHIYRRSSFEDFSSLKSLPLQIFLNKHFRFNPHPWLDYERIEFHHASDIVIEDLPSLADLGIVPANMESRIAWEMKLFTSHVKYMETGEDDALPTPPKPVTAE